MLGVALGIAFGLCFLTGLVSHSIQHPPAWFGWPARPAGLYRVSQGLHVAAGLAAVPLLLAKLWTVYPPLFTGPPVEGPAHAVERLSLLPLVGGAVFLLVSGVANIALWYPWRFSSRRPTSGPPGSRSGRWSSTSARSPPSRRRPCGAAQRRSRPAPTGASAAGGS